MKYWYLLLFPLIILLDIIALNPITSLLSQPSDIKVALGLTSAALLIAAHVYLLRTLYRKLKNE